MSRSRHIKLTFDPTLSDLGKGKRLYQGLSAVVQVGKTLWLAHDEAQSIERLTIGEPDANGNFIATEHSQFFLHKYLKFPIACKGRYDAKQEVDLEGLAYADGYLWLVGSHSSKRKKAKSHSDDASNRDRLASVVRQSNRYLIARIPIKDKAGVLALDKSVKQDGQRLSAAQLKGDKRGNELTHALANDPHLAAFLDIPGKDNGFDIEGLAAYKNRLFLGLRGPVLRGWAMILEIELKNDGKRLKTIGMNQTRYRKHFLDLQGLGIRDLCFHANDLLILAGPSMALDGPVKLFRWPDATNAKQECWLDARQLTFIMDIPYGRGDDHPEGMTLFHSQQSDQPMLLVVNDAASNKRQPSPGILVADIFALE